MGERNLRMTDVRGVEVTTPLNDFVLREKVADQKYQDGVAWPALGTAHSGRFPNHKLCAIRPADEEGHQYCYYVSTRAAQELYNFEHAALLENEWPTLKQTWVVPRAEYAGAVPLAAPPDVDANAWTFIGARMVRLPEPLDGLFVQVEHVYMDITEPLAGVALDGETGALAPFSRKMVPAGTAGSAVDATGQYEEIQPLTTLWSIRNTRQAAGLFGQMVDGVATRTLPDIVNYSWPAILRDISIQAIPGPGGEIAKLTVRPDWLSRGFSGPCRAEIVETATLAVPDVDPPTTMLDLPIEFDGGIMQVHLPPCLHPAFFLREVTGGTERFGAYQLIEEYPATNFTAWPASIVASVTVTPVFGGYLTRTVIVHSPALPLAVNDIRLTVTPLPDGLRLDWTRSNAAGVLVKYVVTVGTDPLFLGGKVVDEQDLGVLTTLKVPDTALVRGVPYYCRVRANFTGTPTPVLSNIKMGVVVRSPRIGVEQPALTILTDNVSAIDFGDVDLVAGTADKTFTVRNAGEQTLSGLALSLTGAHAADWTVQTALGATTLAAGASTTFTLRFNPSATGARAAAVHVASNDPSEDANPFSVHLTGAGVTPEIEVEQPSGTGLTNGIDTVNWGNQAVSTPVAKVFVIRNTGTGPLTGIALNITHYGDPAYAVTAAPAATVAAGANTNFTITFTPPGVGGQLADLEITSNDGDENPFAVTLNGTGI